MKNQLLCTFSSPEYLPETLFYINASYALFNGNLFVFENYDSPDELYVTYTILPAQHSKTPRTISVHRKKDTNTLYTVNALNNLIKRENFGILDKSFIVNWSSYNNMLLLSSGDDLREIRLELKKIIKPQNNFCN